MAFDIPKFDKNTNVGKLAAAVFAALESIDEQLNRKSELFVNDTGSLPSEAKANNSLVATLRRQKPSGDLLQIGIATGKGGQRRLTIEDLGGPYEPPIVPPYDANLHQFLGLITDTVNPNVGHYPNDGDWGFFLKTVGPAWFLVRNFTGTIKLVVLV